MTSKIIAILAALMLAGCSGTATPEIITTQNNIVVMPDPTMFNCPTIQKFPDWQNVTDIQIAQTMETLYKNNETCSNSIATIQKFLNDAKTTTEQKKK